MLSSHCRANRPHLGMCPQIPCSFPMATGISWCIQGSPGESGPNRVEGNNSALLLSCNTYHLEQTEWPKGSQASCGVLREDSGLLPRPCRKRRASSRNDGGTSWLFSSCGASVGFLMRFDGELREPLLWRQGSQVSIRVARGSMALLSSHGRGIGPQDVLKKDS